MTGIRTTGVAVTLLVAVTLAAGGVATEPVDGHGPEQTAVQHHSSDALSMPGNDIPGITLNESEVGLELRPASQAVEPGENGTYDVVITGPDNGVSSYSFNVSVADVSVAEIDSFELDRTGLIDGSFITSDNSTVVFEVSLGNDDYVSSEEITVATVDAAAVGSAGQSTDLAFTYDPNEAVLNNNTEFYTVVTEQSATLAVDGPPTFQVSNLTPAEASAVAGETLNLSADVENVGGPGTQAVDLSIDGYSESKNLTLASGVTQTVLFENVATGALDPGEYTHAIASKNDSASGNLTVLRPANLTVDIVSSEDPVAGENLTVTATVENLGDVVTTQTVTLDAGTLGEDATNVTLGGGNTTEKTLSVPTSEGDAGSYTATVSSGNDTVNATVTVLAPPEFAVDIVSTATPVEGENLTVTAAIENLGDVATTQTITLDAGTLGEDATNVTLGGGNTTEKTLSVPTSEGDAGSYTATVSSGNDTASVNVTVDAPAFFEMAITDIDEEVTAGDPVTLTYEVENVGDVTATQDITFTVEGTTEGTDPDLTLDAGENSSSTFTYSTAETDDSGLNLTVESNDDSASATVTVSEPALLTVTLGAVDEAVAVGDPVTVNYTVENTGDVATTQNVTFAVDGTVEDVMTDLPVGGGETVDGAFSYETVADDTPVVTVGVATADDAASANVTVLAPALFAVEAVETNGPLIAGAELVVTLSVANTGGITANRTVQVDAGPVGSAERVVALGGNESTTEIFTFDSTTEQTGVYNMTADVADDQVLRVVELSPTPLPGRDNPPGDLNTDGLYEDIDGDDSFDIFDIQALFNNLETVAIQQHTVAYNFNDEEDPEAVSIFDVQGLFNRLG